MADSSLVSSCCVTPTTFACSEDALDCLSVPPREFIRSYIILLVSYYLIAVSFKGRSLKWPVQCSFLSSPEWCRSRIEAYTTRIILFVIELWNLELLTFDRRATSQRDPPTARRQRKRKRKRVQNELLSQARQQNV